MTQPLVYAILVQWRSCDDTFACLESLYSTSYPALQVVLVDNGTPPMCRQTLRERFPHVTLITNQRNRGFAAANNQGIALALRQGADYVLVLNNDTLVDPHFLVELLAVINADPAIGMVGPKIVLHDEPQRLWFAGTKLSWLYGRPLAIDHRGFHALDHGQYDRTEPVGFLSGCAMLIRRALLEQIGTFDEAYFAYFEDVDLCLRAQRAGFQLLYVPAARIRHKAASSTTERRNYTPYGVYFATRNALLLMHKHGYRAGWLIFIPFFALKLLRRWVMYTAQRQPQAGRAMLWGIADFLAGYLGVGRMERFIAYRYE